MTSVQTHIGASDHKVRKLGMLVGTIVTATVDPGGPKLNFEVRITAMWSKTFSKSSYSQTSFAHTLRDKNYLVLVTRSFESLQVRYICGSNVNTNIGLGVHCIYMYTK